MPEVDEWGRLLCVPRCAGATVGRMAVVVVLASRTPKEVVVRNPPTLAVDASGDLKVAFVFSGGDTVTAASFERGSWREAWVQPAGTAYRHQYVAAPDYWRDRGS